MAKTKVDIISGFLGAGKTTFIKKLLKDAVAGEQVVLIENEFGEIGIDGGFLKDSGIEIREMNSGCICCSLVGDFATSLKEILTKYSPDRIIIEPSGVGKLSDVMRAVADVEADLPVENNSAVTVVDVRKCRMYMKNFGEFFNNQVQCATTIVLSRTDVADQHTINQAVSMIRELNPTAEIITTPLALLSGKKVLEILEQPVDLKAELLKQIAEEEEAEEHEHEHDHEHHHDHDHEEHEHHHDHDHDEHDHDHDEHDHDHEEHDHEHEHEEHEHDHDHEEHEHHHDHEEHEHHHDHDEHEHHHDHEEHEHHHEYDENGVCSCGHHHHHHDADEVFTSWGKETAHKYDETDIRPILDRLADMDSEEFGIILRAKGIVPDKTGGWLEFDLVPGEYEVRKGNPDYTGKLCVIGSQLKEDKLAELFGL